MTKTEIVRARIDPDLKHNAEIILHKLGLTQAQYINMAFRQLEIKHGIPFDMKLPNKTTQKAIKDAMENKNLTEFKDFDDLLKKSGIKRKINA
jgi:addiction module antitoxin, RelB/DinJ family